MALINLKPLVKDKLFEINSLGRRAFFHYPESFNNLPCVSYYEIINNPQSNADDNEYSINIEFMIDVWGRTADEIEDMATLVDDKIKSIGFIRQFSRDDYDPEKRIKSKNMRYSITKEV